MSGGSVSEFVGMEPDLVADLAVAFRTQAEAAEGSAGRVQAALALAGLSSGVPDRLVARSEMWRTTAAELDHRVELATGFQMLLDAGVTAPPGTITAIDDGLDGVDSLAELNEQIATWSGTDNDPELDALVAERNRQIAALTGNNNVWNFDADVAALAQANSLSYAEAELIARTWALDAMQGEIDANTSGWLEDPTLNLVYDQRRELLLELTGDDPVLAAAVGRLMSDGQPAMDAIFAASADAFADWSIADVEAELVRRVERQGENGFDPFLYSIAAIHAEKTESFAGADSLDVHPGVAAMAEEMGVTYNEAVAMINADLEANPDDWPADAEALPYLDGAITSGGEALVFLSDEDIFRELETATQDLDDYDGKLSTGDLQHVVDHPHDFSDRAVALATFLTANPDLRARLDTARNGDFLTTLGDGEIHVGDTDGIISYADVLASGTNEWVFDTLTNHVDDIDANTDGALTVEEYEAFLDQTDDENLRAALEFAIGSGLDDDDRGLLRTVFDGGWEIASLMPGSPAFLFELATDPRGLAENYLSFGEGAASTVIGFGQFAYDISAATPNSPLFWIESWRVGGDMEQHRGVRLVTAMPALLEAAASLVPLTPWAAEQAENVRRMGTTDAHAGLNLLTTVLNWETFRQDPSRWAGQLAPEVLITVLTGGGGSVTRLASTSQRLLQAGRAALSRLKTLPGLSPRLVARSGVEMLASVVDPATLRRLTDRLDLGSERGSWGRPNDTPVDDLPDFVQAAIDDGVPNSGQIYADLQHQLRLAEDAKIEIDDLAREIAERYDGQVATAPLKGEARAFEKIIDDYMGDATRISDLARNTIVVEPEKIAAIIDELEAAGATVKVADASSDLLGYSGVNAKITTADGVIAEIQVNTPAMIFAKESEANARAILGDGIYDDLVAEFGDIGGHGHVMYERWRSADRQSNLSEDIELASTAYYARFRAVPGDATDVRLAARMAEDLRTAELAAPTVAHLNQTGRLPETYLTHDEARALGWEPGKALGNHAPGAQIGGSPYRNDIGNLPEAPGRLWFEADIGLTDTMRRSNQPGTRLVWSSDGLAFVTSDHYISFVRLPDLWSTP